PAAPARPVRPWVCRKVSKRCAPPPPRAGTPRVPIVLPSVVRRVCVLLGAVLSSALAFFRRAPWHLSCPLAAHSRLSHERDKSWGEMLSIFPLPKRQDSQSYRQTVSIQIKMAS